MDSKRIVQGVERTLEEEGPYWVARKGVRYFDQRLGVSQFVNERVVNRTPYGDSDIYSDVMIINGCDYSVPHPIRYRVNHQCEQLLACGYSCEIRDAWEVTVDTARQANLFIVFRCPFTEKIGEFIAMAKSLNKRVLYDIDDLVIDTKYTDTIPFVQKMGEADRLQYDDGVRRMGQTLQLCDGAITTTEVLAEELSRYVKTVYVNRNTASEDMLHISNDAIFRRDKLPYLENNQIKYRDWAKRDYARKQVALKKDGRVTIGYFSGSITHNADVEMILPSLVEVMDARPNVRLLLMGEIDLPAELQRFSDRVDFQPFCEWTSLPFVIARCDINIAPIQDTIFNQAKSENKWVEASLVGVPTVASRVGAFEKMIEDGVTGLLADSVDEWSRDLLRLVDDESLREAVGDAAREYCLENCTTLRGAKSLHAIIEKERAKTLAIMLPSIAISGGILVLLKHACVLQDEGYDVSLIDAQGAKKMWHDFDGHTFPILDHFGMTDEIDQCPLRGRFDIGVASLWNTVDFWKRYPKVRRIQYIVQNYETDFYLPPSPLRRRAESTYVDGDGIEYLTISKWCKGWLEERYGKTCRFCLNGLDAKRFAPVERDFGEGKIRVLVEGDCGSEYKNVDESFEIVAMLDPERFEVWYMNYTGAKRDFYRIDKFLGAVPQEEIADVYRQCHILLKSSILESFSYPPLEMMATGGFVVVRPNEGNVEFLRNYENCLFYDPDDLVSAVAAIESIATDEDVRRVLYMGGQTTAKARDWDGLREDILALYR